MKKKVLVSSCLLNEICRYDGTTKMDIYDDLDDYEIVPFCPEKFMGVPRKKISLHKGLDNAVHLIREDGLDVTQELSEEIDGFLAYAKGFDKIILKSKSPSCGYKTTPVIDEEKISLGHGLFVQKLLEVYDESIFFDEKNYK